jgi:hypothetical protein
MRKAIAETTGSKKFKCGQLELVLCRMDYGTHESTLACFPDVEIDNIELPGGALDRAQAEKAFSAACHASTRACSIVHDLSAWADEGTLDIQEIA